MRRFALLYSELDASNKTNDKVLALRSYFDEAPAEDAVWTLALVMGRRPRVPVNRTLVTQWALEYSDTPRWLFDECYSAVGDLSETIALILPEAVAEQESRSLRDWMAWLSQLGGLSEEEQRASLFWAWEHLDRWGRLVLHKLIGGSFRFGASKELAIRALAESSGIPKAKLAHRLMGSWEPTAEFFAFATSETEEGGLMSQPYPFCLAYPLEQEPERLGEVSEWQAEWKWDGIRAQLIRREGETFLWSRGEELIHDSFPDVAELGASLPDGTVIDGEILAWAGDRPLPFAQLQRRIGRKVVGKKLLMEVPCALIAFDLLEQGGDDLRGLPLAERRAQLEKVVSAAAGRLVISPTVPAESWAQLVAERERSREMLAEGLMLKRLSSDYTRGRKRGDWWKWKVDPFSVDAVLIYAQRGSGKRASLYTDYTFGVWSEGILVPFAKAYSGLTDAEIRDVDAFVRRNAIEKFGPVRTVEPRLVFEIAFEGIQLSTRHKSGVAVRFPRILRWRKDKRPEDADSLENVRSLLEMPG